MPRVYSQTICKAQVELKALVDEAETLVSLSLSTSTENGVGSSSSSSTSSPSKLLASAIRASITALASNSDESIAAVGSSSSSSISRESLPSYLTPFWRSNDTVDVNKMEEDLKTLFSGKRMLKDAIEAEKKSPNASASIDGGDDDDDISCGDQQINFSCPLSLTRITNPARGNKCKHFQCFDLEVNIDKRVLKNLDMKF